MGFNSTSTLSISGSGFSILIINSDILVKVEDETITLIGATVENASAKSNGDVILKVGRNKLTVKGAGETEITLSENGTTKIFSDGIIYDETKTTATIPVKYRSNKLKTFEATITEIDGTAAKKKLNLAVTSTAGATILGGKAKDSLTGGDGADIFLYDKGDGKDIIDGFGSDDLLEITGVNNITGTVNSKGTEIYLKVGSTNKAITFKNFTTTEFNINGDFYQISGTNFVKK